MKRDRASSTDLEAGRLTGLARSLSGHCPILEAMKRHGFRETVKAVRPCACGMNTHGHPSISIRGNKLERLLVTFARHAFERIAAYPTH